MGAYRLKGYVPADHAVALLAIRSHLPAMNVGVTVRTPSAYVTEYQLGMALDAIHLCVHSQQRIAGLPVVIEFRDRADRLPTRLGMAILAGNRDGAVRVTCLRG